MIPPKVFSVCHWDGSFHLALTLTVMQGACWLHFQSARQSVQRHGISPQDMVKLTGLYGGGLGTAAFTSEGLKITPQAQMVVP